MNQPGFVQPIQPGFGTQGPQIFGPPGPPRKKSDLISKFNNLPKQVKIIISLLIVGIIIYIILLLQSNDGYFTEWSDWSECSKTCNSGERYRTRKYIPKTLFGNDLLDKDIIEEIENCNTQYCPIDGYYTNWVADGECVEKEDSLNKIICGGGKQKYIRSYIEQKHGGIDLEDQTKLIKWEYCSPGACTEATVSDWIDIIKENGKKYYYLDRNIKMYIDECYDPTIKIGNKFITDDNILIDQQRIFTPGKKEKESVQIKLKELYPKDNNDAINNKFNLLKSSNWIETATISKKIKQCTINGLFLTKWKNNNPKSIDGCVPQIGKNRKKTETIQYQFPINGGIHHSELTDNFKLEELNKLNNLKIGDTLTFKNNTGLYEILFKRENDNIPNIKNFTLTKISNCDNKSNPNITNDSLQNLWNETTGCNTVLTDDILIKYNSNMNIENTKYEENTTSFITTISEWAKKNILKYTIKDSNRLIMKDNTNILSQCYSNLPLKLNNLNQKDYIDPSNNIIYPGVQYSDGFQLKNGNFTLIMQTDGNLCIYKNYDSKKLNNDLYWSTEIEQNSKGYLFMQEDGNLVIYDKDNIVKWSSNTTTNNGGYAELLLSKSGNYLLLVIKDKDGKIIKYLNKITLKLINNDKYIYKKNYLELDGGDEVVLNDITCIYPYIKYYYDFKWSNNNFNLIMQADGNLVIYKDKKTSGSNNAIWSSKSSIKNSETFHYRYLILQPDGNLVIYDFNNNSKWSSGTFNQVEKNSNFYAEITNKGYLSILNKDNKILKAFPENILDEYIKNIHWSNSPWTLFADQKNRVWKAFWSDLDKEMLDKEYNDGADYSRFNGIRKNSNDQEWKKQGQIDLNHIEGYHKVLNNDLPKYNEDNNDFNYNTSNDRTNFNKNLPIIIPGYNRISKVNGTSASDTSNFLISARSGTLWDQAFVLYKLKNKNDYYNDLIINNKLLVRKMIDNDIMKIIIGGSNTGFTESYRNNIKLNNNVASFSNKSMFFNKINNDLENFINYRIQQKNKSNLSNKLNNAYLETILY